jgi:ATP-dependent helicase STH1/SNF2
MNMMMQLRKICDHPYLFIDGGYLIDDIMIRSSGKFELLEKMLIKLVSTGHRMLIFTQMTRLLDILEEFLTYIKI